MESHSTTSIHDGNLQSATTVTANTNFVTNTDHGRSTETFVMLYPRCRSIWLLFIFAGVFHFGAHRNAVFAMRLVVQRVKSASVTVEGKIVSEIGPGVLALVGLHEHDQKQDLQECCKKLLACKLWENESGGMWRHSVKQKGFEVLLVSQFTLYGTLSKKSQPDYKLAMKSDPAKVLYQEFVEMVRQAYEKNGDKVKDGIFGEMMDVALVNDGPVTLVIETEVQAPGALPSESD